MSLGYHKLVICNFKFWKLIVSCKQNDYTEQQSKGRGTTNREWLFEFWFSDFSLLRVCIVMCHYAPLFNDCCVQCYAWSFASGQGWLVSVDASVNEQRINNQHDRIVNQKITIIQELNARNYVTKLVIPIANIYSHE